MPVSNINFDKNEVCIALSDNLTIISHDEVIISYYFYYKLPDYHEIQNIIIYAIKFLC